MNSATKNIKSINQKILKQAAEFEWDVVGDLLVQRQKQIEKMLDLENAATPQQLNALLTIIKEETEHCDLAVNKIIQSQKKLNIKSSINLKNSFDAAKKYQRVSNASTS